MEERKVTRDEDEHDMLVDFSEKRPFSLSPFLKTEFLVV